MKLRRIKRRTYHARGFSWGKRCKTYQPGCIVCEAHRFFDRYKYWPESSELEIICSRVMEQEA